jgi:rod shape-determining protein MreC
VLDIRKRTGYLFLAVMLAQVILISAQVQTKSGTRALQAVTFEVFSRVSAGTSSVVHGTRNFWGNYVGLRGVKAENDALKRQLGELQIKLQEEHALAARTQRLQALLDLKTQAALPTLAAEVIAGNPDPVLRSVTIDRGSADGVQPDMAVIAPGGLVGRVISPVGRTASRVQLLIDHTAAAGALVGAARVGGIVVGADADPPLQMELVSNLADVKVGDEVVASGVDGIYPKGYVIGRVERTERGAGLYRTVAVRPGVDFSSLEEVLVVLVPAGPAVRDEAQK